MNLRSFLRALAAAPALGLFDPFEASADLPKAKITRVRIFRPPNFNPLFNQSNMVVTVETDIGITGIGEGGSKDTLEQVAGLEVEDRAEREVGERLRELGEPSHVGQGPAFPRVESPERVRVRGRRNRRVAEARRER